MIPLRTSFALLAWCLVALPSHAQYKVVGPDGRITYTDRAPGADPGRTQPAGRDATAATEVSPNAGLPFELRQISTRFPVTLFTSTDCAPCETGRRLLQTRGIPYVERRILNEDDAEAMIRLTGGRSVPTLTIGTQALRGLSDTDWHAYLDAAGYPRESKLPRGYQPPTATPLVERAAEPRTASAARAASAPERVVPVPPESPPSPTGIRF